MSKPKPKKGRAAAAQRRGQILSVLCAAARLEIDESICFQVTPREFKESVPMLRERVHKKMHDSVDTDTIDAFLDRIIADPTHFFPTLGLAAIARTKTAYTRLAQQAIEEHGLTAPVEESIEYERERETRIRLTGSNGKTAFIMATWTVLQ